MVTIYALTCLQNGKAYIGCTAAKPSKRFREHRCLLNARVHSEPDLQADWTRYGEAMFRMESVYELEADSDVHAKRAAETNAMQAFKRHGLLYNRNEASFAPSRNGLAQGMQNLRTAPVGNRWSPEANLKRSLAQRGKPKGHGAKISATKRAQRAVR